MRTILLGLAAAACATGQAPRLALSQLPQDAALARRFADAKALGAAGELVRAIPLAQQALDAPADTYAPGDAGAELPLRLAVERWLLELGPNALAEYRRQEEDVAAADLKAALDAQDEAALASVAARRFLTRSGYAAANVLATRLWDRGWHELAIHWWTRLLESPGHAGENRAALRVKLALAKRQLEGAGGDPAAVAADLAAAGLRLPEPALAEVAPRTWPAPVAAGALFQGSPERAGAEGLGEPLFFAEIRAARRPLTEHAAFKALAARDGELAREQDRLRLPGGHVAGLDGVAYFRTFGGLHAVRLPSGEPAWPAPWRDALDLDRQTTSAEAGRALRGVFADLTLGYSAHLGLAADDRRVYAIDRCILQRTLFGLWNRNPAESARRSVNALVALDRQTGKPLWRVGAALPKDQPPTQPLPETYFHGPPLPVEGRLFALAEQRSETTVFEFDPATGRTLARRPVCVAERRIDAEPVRRAQAAALAYARGVLVCGTGLNRAAAFDALSGTLLWNRTFNDDSKAKLARDEFADDAPTWPAQEPDAPCLAEGAVLFAEPTLGSLHCLELGTGATRWKASRQGLAFLAGVRGGRVLMIGLNAAKAFALADGKLLWTETVPTASGRGGFAGGKYWFPTERAGLASLDLATGKLALQAVGAPNAVALGNIAACGDTLVSWGRDGVRAFAFADSARREADALLARNPADPHGQFLAAALELHGGRLAPAASAFAAVRKAPGVVGDRETAREGLFMVAERADPAAFPAAFAAEFADELRRAARTPGETAAARQWAARQRLSQGRPAEALALAEDAAAAQPPALLPPDREDCEVAAAAWAEGFAASAWAALPDEPRAAAALRLDERFDAALAKGDLALAQALALTHAAAPRGRERGARWAAALAAKGLVAQADLARARFAEPADAKPADAKPPANPFGTPRRVAFRSAVKRDGAFGAQLRVEGPDRSPRAWVEFGGAGSDFRTIDFATLGGSAWTTGFRPQAARLSSTRIFGVGNVAIAASGGSAAAVSLRADLAGPRLAWSHGSVVATSSRDDDEEDEDRGRTAPDVALRLVHADARRTVLQERRTVRVLDTATGRTAWTRGSLAPAQVFGDGEALAIVEPRRTAVELRRTADGAALGMVSCRPFLPPVLAVEIDNDRDEPARGEPWPTAGRGVLQAPANAPEEGLELFDPLRKAARWSVKFPRKSRVSFQPEQGWVLLEHRTGEFVLLNAETGAEIARGTPRGGGAPKPEQRRRAFLDAERLYIVTVDATVSTGLTGYAGFHGVAFGENVEVMAFRRQGHAPAWKKPVQLVGPGTLVFGPVPELPCFLADYQKTGFLGFGRTRALAAYDKATGVLVPLAASSAKKPFGEMPPAETFASMALLPAPGGWEWRLQGNRWGLDARFVADGIAPPPPPADPFENLSRTVPLPEPPP